MFEPPEGTPVSETGIEVRSYELDSFGHVNHAVFLNYLEHGRFQALRDWGFPYESLVARGWGVYVVRIEVDYVKEARLGQRLLVRTWVQGFKRTSMVLAQDLRSSGDFAEVARALVTAVFVGENRRPMRVPDPIRHGIAGGRS